MCKEDDGIFTIRHGTDGGAVAELAFRYGKGKDRTHTCEGLRDCRSVRDGVEIMRHKTKLIILSLIMCLVSCGAKRNEPQNEIDWKAAGFTEMSTTAYCVGHHTANGSAVHAGGCACSIDHIGDIAIVYTLDGNFLGYYECNDTGAEGGGVRAGRVIDIYRRNLTQCEMYMRITGGRVYVKWIEGEG